MRRFVCLLLVLIFSLTISEPVFADYSDDFTCQIESDNYGDNTRAEETTWVYWRHDGVVERRLWSITYGVWLTDWEIIGYYDP